MTTPNPSVSEIPVGPAADEQVMEAVGPADPADMQLAQVRPYAAARAICRRHTPSGYFCSFFLPITKRSAAFAVYSYCHALRETSRMRDSAEATGQIAEHRRTLEQIYNGAFQPGDASEHELATAAFAEAVEQYNIPRQWLVDLVQGCEMDLSISRYQTWEDLSTYCYHTGGVVGLILCRILGLKTASAREHAVQMGKAVRLTEILRDVKADLQRGRIYLPQEDLERFGVSEASLRAETSDGSFHHLMQFQINRARMMYREASQGICQLPQDGSRLAASALAVMSAGILNLIERCNYDVFRHQVSLSPWQRLARLPLAWRLCRRNYDHPLPDVFAAG